MNIVAIDFKIIIIIIIRIYRSNIYLDIFQKHVIDQNISNFKFFSKDMINLDEEKNAQMC